MIEKTTYKCEKCGREYGIGEIGSLEQCYLDKGKCFPVVWVLKSEHEELVKKLTKEILDLSYEITELKGKVQK